MIAQKHEIDRKMVLIRHKYILLILLAVPFSSHALEDDSNIVKNLMVTAKATGMCGVFSQMVAFQDSTKMPGGDEFIVRFLNTEAVRLGYELNEFMKTCPIVVKKYNDTMSLLNSE